MRFDSEAAVSRPAQAARVSWIDRLYRIPSALLRDPLGAVVEKELRFLSRAPRFRLIFLMGFSFGLLIWLPIAFGPAGGAGSAIGSNYLTLVSAYALLLLGEVTFWNSFGFDRAAAQLYFLCPVPIRVVLAGKNLAAALFVTLEVTLVAAACGVVGMPLSWNGLAEAYAVALVLSLLMLAVGNLGSVRYARPVEPRHSWRTTSAARFQGMLLLVYPVLAFPVALAFLARYAFQSQAAFYGVLAFDAALGAVLYWVALDSAVATIIERREAFLAALTANQGPVAT